MRVISLALGVLKDLVHELPKEEFCVICVISLGVSTDLVHELPRITGRASTPHSVVFQGSGAPRDHATLLLRERLIS